jgi:hypothetical protein
VSIEKPWLRFFIYAIVFVLLLLGAGVAPERSRGSELTQFMTHQIFSDHDLDMLSAVVNQKRIPNKLRNNGTSPSPSLDGFLRSSRLLLLNFQIQFLVNVWTFFL